MATSSGGTWYQWVTADTTTASTDNTAIWRAWSSGTATTSATVTVSSSSDAVWYTWNDGANTYRVQSVQAKETDAQKQARLAREEEWRIKAEQEAKAKAEAEARANELLESHLTDEQRRQLKELDAFIINAKSKQYRIRKGWSGNVDEIKDGRVVARLCIHPQVTVPYADHMLAQKFMLETNEPEFLRIANRTPVRDGELVPLAN